jgi:hypothetical protein
VEGDNCRVSFRAYPVTEIYLNKKKFMDKVMREEKADSFLPSMSA